MDKVRFLGFALHSVGNLARELLVAFRSDCHLRHLHHPQSPLELLEKALQGRGEAQRVERMARCHHLCRHLRHLHQHLFLPGLQNSFILNGEDPVYG